MKLNIRFLCLLLVIAMLVPMLFACGGDVNTEEEKTEEEKNESSSDTVDYGGTFPILKDGKYTVRVIMSDSATDSEKAVYSKL